MKTSWRALRRDARYILVNLGGLGAAFACCLVLGVYAYGELSFDRHHLHHDRLFRVANEVGFNDLRTFEFAVTAPALGPMLAEDFAVIQAVTRLRPMETELLRHRNDGEYWQHLFIADSNVFTTFTHEIVLGDAEHALVAPNAMAVSETFARRYFGDANPIGELIARENGAEYEITLVFADLPKNSHVRYDALFSYSDERLALPPPGDARLQSLLDLSDYTYLLLPETYEASAFDALGRVFFERHLANTPYMEGDTWRIRLQPLTDIHLFSNALEDEATGNRFYVYGFMTIAACILAIAAINYVNLATARAGRRAKEVGVRKVLGAKRRSIAAQILTESVLASVISLVIGTVIAGVALRVAPIDEWLGVSLSSGALLRLDFIAASLTTAIVVGAIAGTYPALRLSSVAAFKGTVPRSNERASGAKRWGSLVAIQTALSVGIVACTLIMALQLRHLASQPLGFEKEDRLLVNLRGADLIEQAASLATELKRNPNVLGVAETNGITGRGSVSIVEVEDNAGRMQPVELGYWIVTEDFVDVMGLDVVAGRNFSRDMLGDADSAVLVNEALVRQMGWEQPIGKRLAARDAIVVGVVKDFNSMSLHSPVQPFALFQFTNSVQHIAPERRPFAQRLMIIKFAKGRAAETVKFVESALSRFDRAHPFDYEFLDSRLDELYVSEKRLVKRIGTFAAVSILIASLGVVGLVAYLTEQTTKEIGIRKALGASKAQIVALLGRKVLHVVLAGSVVAAAVVYPTMVWWLGEFAYRIPVHPLTLVVAALPAIGLACASVWLQASRIAASLPAETLRGR